MPFRRDWLRCLGSRRPTGGHRAGSVGVFLLRHLLEAFAPVPAVSAYLGILRRPASSRCRGAGVVRCTCRRPSRRFWPCTLTTLGLLEAFAPVPAVRHTRTPEETLLVCDCPLVCLAATTCDTC